MLSVSPATRLDTANRCAVPRYPRVSDNSREEQRATSVQVDCDHTCGIAVDRQLPRIINYIP